MSVLPTRYNLLRARLERFSRAFPGIETGDIHAVHQTRVASRRLRELLPVLQLEGKAAGKLSHQLRKVTRRLGGVREADVMLVRDAARGEREEARGEIPGKTASESFGRLVRKLDRASRKLEEAEDAQTRRAWRWALDARVSRRAVALRLAIDKAGSVYLADRLHATRITLKKLRYAVELDVDARGLKSTNELRTLKRMQDVLGRLHDMQVLVDHVRRVQAALTPPSVTAWRDMDTLLTGLEQNCRRLHARYVGERERLIDICDRLARRSAPAKATPRRRRAG